MIGFIDTLYIYTVRDYRQYGAIAILHTFHFTVTHPLGLPVFTSLILATDLSQSHCNFRSHVKTSWHRLIPFLPFLQLPIPKTRLHSTTLDYCCILRCTPSTSTTPVLLNTSYNHFERISRKTQPVFLTNLVYRAVA
jgi:hypothetical protein